MKYHLHIQSVSWKCIFYVCLNVPYIKPGSIWVSYIWKYIHIESLSSQKHSYCWLFIKQLHYRWYVSKYIIQISQIFSLFVVGDFLLKFFSVLFISYFRKRFIVLDYNLMWNYKILTQWPKNKSLHCILYSKQFDIALLRSMIFHKPNILRKLSKSQDSLKSDIKSAHISQKIPRNHFNLRIFCGGKKVTKLRKIQIWMWNFNSFGQVSRRAILYHSGYIRNNIKWMMKLVLMN